MSGKSGANGGAPGALFVVSAPSGAGKTSLVRALAADEPGVVLSISHTTRPPRPGEVEGEHYHFVTDAAFERMVGEDAFLEHARVFDHRYGTARAGVAEARAGGLDVVLEIDWQGARQVRGAAPDSIGVFVVPPSRGALEARLRGRGQDPPEVIARRMAAAEAETSHWREFDYLVVNEEFEAALADLRCLVRAQRLRRERQAALQRTLIESLLAP